jgi:hypothetical protein
MAVRAVVRTALALSAVGLFAAGPANAAFSVVPSPNAGAGNNALNGVSAGSASDAWAVGTVGSGKEDAGIGTLTERWNGAAWSVVPSPDTLHNDDVLNGVADLTPSNAWAVGLVKTSGVKTGAPLIVHWNGTSWQTVAPPAGVTGKLRAISADRPSDLWAVGDDGRGHAIAFRSDGTSWISTTLPAVGIDNLQGVKAFSPSDVWAVGGLTPSSGTAQGHTVVMHWNGSAWSVVPSANPDPNVDTFHAVDGVASNDLWAVGQQARSTAMTGVAPGTRTLAEHWSGTRWTAVTTPNSANDDSLNGVAVLASTSAFSVGTSTQPGGSIPVNRTIAARWNGASWAGDPSGNVGTTDNLLSGAAAIPGTHSAWAVGFRLTAAGPDQTLIEQDTSG